MSSTQEGSTQASSASTQASTPSTESQNVNRTRSPLTDLAEGKIDLNALSTALTNIKLGLNKGSRTGSFELDEARVLAENYDYLNGAINLVVKSLQQQQQNQGAAATTPAPAQ